MTSNRSIPPDDSTALVQNLVPFDSSSVPEQLRAQANSLSKASAGMLLLAISTLVVTAAGLGVLGSLVSTSKKDYLTFAPTGRQPNPLEATPNTDTSGAQTSKTQSRFDKLCNQRSIGAPTTDVDYLCLESFSANYKFQVQSNELRKAADNARSLLEANQRLQKSEGFQKLFMEQQMSIAKHNYEVELNRQKSEAERLRFSQLTGLATDLLGRFALVLLGLYAVRVFFERSRRSGDRASSLYLSASLIELGLSENKNALPLVKSFSTFVSTNSGAETGTEPINPRFLNTLVEKIPSMNSTQKS